MLTDFEWWSAKGLRRAVHMFPNHMFNLILNGSALSLTIQSSFGRFAHSRDCSLPSFVSTHFITRVELSFLKGCHKSDERQSKFLFPTWKNDLEATCPCFGTEIVWILNPRIVLKIKPNLNKLSWLFSVCFSSEAVETIRLGRLHTVFLASSCLFCPRSRHTGELKKWIACQIIGSSPSCDRDICKRSVTGAFASTFDTVRISATDCYQKQRKVRWIIFFWNFYLTKGWRILEKFCRTCSLLGVEFSQFMVIWGMIYYLFLCLTRIVKITKEWKVLFPSQKFSKSAQSCKVPIY